MTLEKRALEALDADFDEGRVKTKQVKGRPDVSYLESYDIINKANEVFGYGEWGTEIADIELHNVGGKTLAVAQVKLYVQGAMPREDVGAVIAASKSEELTPEALETAVKGAVSDAMKRAFRHYGTQFGNSLYDKERESGNGKKPVSRAPEKPPAKATGGRVSSDPTSKFYAYAKSKGIEGSAASILEDVGGDFEKGLIRLKELCGE